jgi:hypothetical protein
MSYRDTQNAVNVLNQPKFTICVVNVFILCRVLYEYVHHSRDFENYGLAVWIDTRVLTGRRVFKRMVTEFRSTLTTVRISWDSLISENL